MLRIALVAPVVLWSFNDPGPAPAPVTTKYRVETRVDQVQDLSAFGQGEQTIIQEQAALIRVTLSDTVGGKVMHVVVDSLWSAGPMAPPAAALQALKGAWIHGYLDAQGRARVVAASNDTSDALSQLRSAMHTFHPRLLGRFSAGDTWADTAVVESRSSSQTSRTSTITVYTARGEENVGGVNARRLESTFTASTTGKIQNPMAGELDLEAKESGRGVSFVSRDGRFLGGSASATGNATVSSPMLPAPIPIKTTRTSTVTVID